MMKVTRKQKGHKKKKRPSHHESPASSVAHLISALFFGIPLTPPPEVVFPATSEQLESNLVTVSLSIHGLL
ncbi:hypothetical protein E2C01_096416 [Portunus trituberculatus]|uniref:Uncharacterized protein n=1 Tax=Portunus trituberculatus TaxID=210409 RepID=A0A5B7JVJ8_PORTR|nr:hypothetical protein [Portunus trituberculatus]